MKRLIPAFLRFRKWFTESKVWIQRSMSYIAIVNSGMILFLLLAKLQDYGFSIHITKWFFPIFLVSIVAMLVVGYLDDKLGFHKEEHLVSQKRNPYFQDIVERLDKIEKELKKKK